MKRAFSWLTALLFPPVCRCCGKRQNIFAPLLPQPLCPTCLREWAERMQERCPTCAKTYPHCSCMTQPLRDAGCTDMVKLTCYRTGRYDVTAHMLLRCKDVNDRALFDFLAADLTLPAFRAMQAVDADVRRTVVTCVPRSRRATRKIGHDHAKKLAEALGARLEIPCRDLIYRRAQGTEQKELSADERLENAAHSFALRRKADVWGKTVLLVDDICTTGATLAHCTKLLLEGGAERVIGVCVAQSKYEKQTE